MKLFRAWKEVLAQTTAHEDVALVMGRGGDPTLKVKQVFLHSQYNPRQEATRLIDAADLDAKRPVLVVGLGLGYHVMELLARGFTIAVLEPDPVVARLALEGPAEDMDFLLGVGDVDDIAQTGAFQQFAGQSPQLLPHPPTARIWPEYANAVTAALSRAALVGQRLNIAVVGPMYGGSLPIAGYLSRAFESLGHRVLRVDNDQAWPLYQEATDSLKTPKASAQLGAMLTNFLAEWCYTRVAEFNPEICIVLAQAPVRPDFPTRLAKNGTVSAFWYVENWRHLPYWKDIAPRYDYFFHIQPGDFEQQLDAIGCRNHAFVQTACDPELHAAVTLTPEEEETYSCDCSFAGAGYNNRLEVFKGLTDYTFKLWGVGWPSRELAPHVVGGEQRFDSDEFMKIVAGSAINLNLHSSTTAEGIDPKCDAINPRVFEIAAAGGFQLCDPCIGLESLFDFETELPVYRNLKELRERIDHFLAHPEERKAIARKAQERVLNEHTYAHRAQQMLECILDKHGARILKRGIRVQRTVGEMLERIEVDSKLMEWLQKLPPETPFTQERLSEFIPKSPQFAAYPANLLRYMNHLREYSEGSLREQR